VQAGSTVYVAGSGNEFGTIDLTTGTFTPIGTLNLPANDVLYGMGFGANGNLYGLDNQSNANLWQINVTNGNVTNIGAVGESAIGSSADAAGKMFSLSQDASAIFYTLNSPSLTTNVVGATGITGDGLAAVNAAGTAMYTSIIPTGGGTDHIGRVDVNTGMVTDLGDSGFSVYTGLFVQGTLYGFDGFSDVIITINTTTGAGTQIATYSLPNGDAIDASATFVGSSSIPEPSSLALSLIATAAAASFGAIRHRRRSDQPR